MWQDGGWKLPSGGGRLSSFPKVLLTAPVRLLRKPLHGEDWAFINWRYKVVQGLVPFLGAYPEVAVKRGILRVVSPEVGSGDIDLIPAGFSSRKSEETSPSEWERKLEIARKRLSVLLECGKEGHLELVVRLQAEGVSGETLNLKKKGGKRAGTVEGRYHPHRCHSIFCPYCSWVNFKESYSRILPLAEELTRSGRLSFLTLTHKNKVVSSGADVQATIDEAYRGITKFYQFRLFGKRNWAKVKGLFAREVLAYYRNAKAKYGVKEARRRASRQIRFFRDFERRYGSFIGSDIKLGQLLNAIVKFELTAKRTDEGWELHPHWHLIVADFYIPKLLVVVIWRLVTGSDIVDLRAVERTKDAVAELTKYVTKGWEIEDKELRKWIEACMIGRKKFRLWGFEVVKLAEKEEEEEVEVYHLWSLRVELVNRANLHEVPRLVRRMRRRGVKEARIDKVIIYDQRVGAYEAELWLRDDGRLIVRGEVFENLLEEYLDLIRLFGRVDISL